MFTGSSQRLKFDSIPPYCDQKPVHEKPDLPETFHERHTREFGGESGALPSPRKKFNLGFPPVLRAHLHSSVSS